MPIVNNHEPLNTIESFLLSQLKQNYLLEIDLAFGKTLYQLDPNPMMMFFATLTSMAVNKGHSCLNLNNHHNLPYWFQTDEYTQLQTSTQWIAYTAWPQILDNSLLVSDGSKTTPLVFDQYRLYLHRYWIYEQTIAQFFTTKRRSSILIEKNPLLLQRCHHQIESLFTIDFKAIWNDRLTQFDYDNLKNHIIETLDIIYPDNICWENVELITRTAKKPEDLQALNKIITSQHCINWQKIAVAQALLEPTLLISGGPGTGKTTTVAKILMIIADLLYSQNKDFKIALVAPTGKAAARLSSSINQAIEQLSVDPIIKTLLPKEATTIHRLLGKRLYYSKFSIREHLLDIDYLIVDEASMIDLKLMYQLIQSLQPHTALIFIGDQDQLSSVEAGSIFGDLCTIALGNISKNQANRLKLLIGTMIPYTNKKNQLPIQNYLCTLKKSYRFDHHSGIGMLANAINTGSAKAIERTLKTNYEDLTVIDIDQKNYFNKIIDLVYEHFIKYNQAISAKQDEETILSTFENFQLLLPTKQGDAGIYQFNQAIERKLIQNKVIQENEIWYQGKPIIILKNNAHIGLFNGDIGIVTLTEQNKPRILFRNRDGEYRYFLPAQLPEHENAFAITIHKSQGSEFNRVALLISEKQNTILSRELLYTAITRAKKHFFLVASRDNLLTIAKKNIQRDSGLMAAIKNNYQHDSNNP